MGLSFEFQLYKVRLEPLLPYLSGYVDPFQFYKVRLEHAWTGQTSA